MAVKFRVFKSGGMFSGPEACLKNASEQAAAFASALSPEELLGFSQSFPQHNMAYVTVWFRTNIAASNESSEDAAEDASIEGWLDESKSGT